MLRIDVNSSRELQATILSIRQADRKIQAEIRKQTKGSIQGEWQRGLAQNADTRLEHLVLVKPARTTVSNQNVRLTAGASVKKLSKAGGSPSSLAKAVEFGADRSTTSTYTARSSKGRTYQVRNRHTRAQFRPVNRKGYVAYPVAADLIPRFASLWVQTTIKTFLDAVERKG